MSSISGLTGSSIGAANTRFLRSGGTAKANACRTVRRCTRCFCASSRIDSSSRRRSRRITSNNSTLDLTLAPSGHQT
jgi:hypothetical protein